MADAFGFAWVDEENNVFLPEYFREDVSIKALSRTHDENENPKLSIVFKNPLEGPLAPGRKQWAWVSWINAADEVEPIFFGKLVPLPNDLVGERITYDFVARASDQDEQMQTIAEGLKTLPGYDRVFIDAAKADDPNTVLEAYPLLWHVGPIDLVVSVSDIISGEDGFEYFQLDDEEVPYNSVKQEINQNPQSVIKIIGEVGWTQSAEGVVGTFGANFQTYTGDGFISEWPKVLADLGEGYSVETSSVVDVYNVADATSTTYTSKYENKEKEHVNGDVLTVDVSITSSLANGRLEGLTEHNQIGFFDPYADPQKNIPASNKTTSILVPLWTLRASMTLRYKAARERTERVRIVLRSDLQVETANSDPEVVAKNGNDVGLPMINALNWLSVKGQTVTQGEVIVVDTEFTKSVYQAALQGGTAGLIEPTFSDTLGDQVTDGTVIWISLTAQAFSSATPNWLPNAITTAGQFILPKPPSYVIWDNLLPLVPPPSVGVSVPQGLIVKRRNGASFQQVQTAGTTGTVEPDFNNTRGATTVDNTVTWVSLGPTLPGSSAFQFATNGGTTGTLEPVFGNIAGMQTTDNGVIWVSLGTLGAMIGPAIGDLSSSSYFASDRGQDSIKYLINFGRAKLLSASRAVKISFDVPFARAVPITLRKNGQLFDRRIPGDFGVYGKIISCSLTVEDGRRFGTIIIACCVGKGGIVTNTPGVNMYIDNYIDGYYAEEGGIFALESGDIGYTRPVYKSVDDKLNFNPLTKNQVIVREEMHGSLAEQGVAITHGLEAQKTIANLPEGGSAQQSIVIDQQKQQLSKVSISSELQKAPIWYDLELVSMTGGNFNYQYDIETTVLKPPKQIDLAAEAS